MAVRAESKEGGKFVNFKPGDTIRVYMKVVEGDSERIQAFEGVCIRRRGRGVSESFTVRKISFGVGVERILPIQSPRIQKIELVKTGKARRAKLYYLRKLRGKAARLQERGTRVAVPESGTPPQEPEAPATRAELAKSVDENTPKAEAAAA